MRLARTASIAVLTIPAMVVMGCWTQGSHDSRYVRTDFHRGLPRAVATWESIARFGSLDNVQAVDLSSDGRYALVASLNREATIWQAAPFQQ